MKLHYSKSSPFVRKVVMVAREAGLQDRIDLHPADAWGPESPVADDNPLGKVPALVLDDGSALYDSPVICEYLDSLHGGTPLFPPAPRRWTALRLQALADGICDAAILRRLETLRPEQERSATWIERQRMVMQRGCDRLEREVADLEGPVDIGILSVLAALDYLRFRWGHEDWRQGRPNLTAWFERASDRPSFRNTMPD